MDNIIKFPQDRITPTANNQEDCLVYFLGDYLICRAIQNGDVSYRRICHFYGCENDFEETELMKQTRELLEDYEQFTRAVEMKDLKAIVKILQKLINFLHLH